MTELAGFFVVLILTSLLLGMSVIVWTAAFEMIRESYKR